LRLPVEVIHRWRATGPGWQTRMAERLAKAPLPRDSEKTPAPDLALARKRRKGLESWASNIAAPASTPACRKKASYQLSDPATPGDSRV